MFPPSHTMTSYGGAGNGSVMASATRNAPSWKGSGSGSGVRTGRGCRQVSIRPPGRGRSAYELPYAHVLTEFAPLLASHGVADEDIQRVFGGQVLAQSLLAAARTVRDDRLPPRVARTGRRPARQRGDRHAGS